MSSSDSPAAPGGRRPVTLIWTHDPAADYHDWLLFLLEPVLGEQKIVEAPTVAEPGALYVVKTNSTPLADFPPSFYASVRATPGVGLFCGDDEWFSGDYAEYRHFGYVLRFDHPARFRHPGVYTAPLGYTNLPAGRAAAPAPASRRTHLWFFAGGAVGSRPEMLAALDPLEPKFTLVRRKGRNVSEGRLDKLAYHATLADSVFAPCPMGNVMIETHRVYEALENGAIPIVERRPFRDYYRDLFGDHPIPTFGSWREAARFVDASRREPGRLDALQAEVTGWWEETKSRVRAEVADFVAAGAADRLRAHTARFPYRRGKLLRKADQAVELARHHSVPAAWRRATTSVSRLLTTGSIISASRRRQRRRA